MNAELISRGNHRTIWTSTTDSEVVKIPRYNTRFDHRAGLVSNQQEWEIYHELASPKLQQFLCVPLLLEYGGLVLVMERGEPITREELPVDGIPSILVKNDNTYPNWVKINGVYKRCDYHAIYEPLKKKRRP